MEIRQGRQYRCEMETVFHREEPLHVLQNEVGRLLFLQHVDDPLEESSSRIADALLLARTAEGLTWEACCEQFVVRNLGEEPIQVALPQFLIAEPTPINRT